MSRLAVVSVVDAAAQELRDDVLHGRLAPGTGLTEADVASRFDVARPTAKAAIQKLVSEGMLERGNHKTARVRRLGPDDVRDIYATRTYLESEVLRRLARAAITPPEAREANERIRALPGDSAMEVVEPDMLFHTALVDALGSIRMSRIYRSLTSEVRLCMAQVQGRNLLSTHLIASEHHGLLELIAAGEGDAAASLLEVHLGRARERLAAALGGTAGPEAWLPSPFEEPGAYVS